MIRTTVMFAAGAALGHIAAADERPFLTSKLIFPLEHWQNHASAIVETPKGDLLVCRVHGSREHQPPDVRVEGARHCRGTRAWKPGFTLADTSGYPHTNSTVSGYLAEVNVKA